MNSNFSNHIFLFPFSWKLKQGEKTKTELIFSETVRLDKVHTLVEQDERWQINTYDRFEQPEDYNEYIYFYPFVREVLYDSGQPTTEDSPIRHYEFKPARSRELEYVVTASDGRELRLQIESILLNLYNTGVGLLSFHLRNIEPSQQKWEDILSINEYGRRLYPAFLVWSDDPDKAFSVKAAKGAGLAESIAIKSIKKGKKTFITFDDFEKDTSLSQKFGNEEPDKLRLLPRHIIEVLPSAFKNSVNITPTIDDRMFVVSGYCDSNKTYSENVTNQSVQELGTPWSFDENFYKYIFVDTTYPGLNNPSLMKQFLKDHINDRWIGSGTVFGASRYSFVAYSTWDLIITHTRTMYYKIAELCLLQRASVLQFTLEVRRLSTLTKSTTLQLNNQLSNLYRSYIQFVNKIYFREVTPQEQGIELYDLLQQKMRIKEEIKDLDAEIQELYNYVSLLEEKERNRSLELITIVGSLFVLPSFVMAFWGMSDMHFVFRNPLGLIVCLALLSVGSLIVSRWQKKPFHRGLFLGKGYRFWIFISVVMFAIFLLLLHYSKIK